MTRIGILHPGAMGSAVGACLVGLGHDVVWLRAGRGEATHRRAREAGLRPVEDLDGCAVVLSVVPPAAAVGTARAVAGFRGLFVDANAISPTTAHEVAESVTAGGADYVDGGIIGPPPVTEGTTRLYLSGPRAAEVAGAFDGSALHCRVLPDDRPDARAEAGPYAASALKMTYAAWTKISAALLLAARASAARLGVEDELAAEWELSQPDLDRRLRAAARDAQAKGWRWTDEMREIGRTLAATGQPGQFGEAAADVFGHFPRQE